MSANSDFYRTRANECTAEAEAAKLDNVRERCLRSAAAWDAMAERLDRAESMRSRLATEKAALALAGSDAGRH